MMPNPAVHAAIRHAAETVRHAAATLDRMLYAACPGPHLYRKHRDRRPPWCAACRYTTGGERVPE